MASEEVRPDERRQHPRRSLRGASRLQVAKHPVVETRTVDVSASGLGIIAPINPPTGMACNIRFLLPIHPERNVTISTTALVTHSVFTQAESGFKVGLMFTDLSPQTLGLLVRDVNR